MAGKGSTLAAARRCGLLVVWDAVLLIQPLGFRRGARRWRFRV